MHIERFILHLPKILDQRGNLTFLQFPNQIPFDIQRVFWTYCVPFGETRGGNSNIIHEEIIIALRGSFDVVIKNKEGVKERITLNRPYFGLHIPRYTWRQMENFSTNSLSLHICSSRFEERDYERNFDNLKY